MMKKIFATAILYGIGSLGMGGDFISYNFNKENNRKEFISSSLERKVDFGLIEFKDSDFQFEFETFYNLDRYKKKEIEENKISKFSEAEYMKRRDVERIVDSLYLKMNVPILISKEFFMHAVQNESSFNKNAISPVGARGLAQIMPKTWEQYNPEKEFEEYSFDPSLNLKTGLEVYKNVYYFVKNHNPNWENLSREEKLSNVIAGYNWGIGKLKHQAEWDLARLPDETKGYIKNVFKKLS